MLAMQMYLRLLEYTLGQQLIGALDGSGLWQHQCLGSVDAGVGLNRDMVRCSRCPLWSLWWPWWLYVSLVTAGGNPDGQFNCCICDRNSETLLQLWTEDLMALLVRRRLGDVR